MSAWETIIGLEVHCQLKTRTKLFCGCRNEFGAPPNSHTCPVCTGQPGALPVLNEEALALALRAAVALGCDVAPRSKFDRKNYFYCDLPKGYQVSQYDEPYCTGGGIDVGEGRFVRLTRIHLEEDAGKAIHDRGDSTLVDLNRAGVPLIESVTEADMRSADEAYAYLTAIKEIFRFAGVSDCDMEKGSLRCDVNVSVHREGEPWGTKVELKNLNSFRNVRDAIEHEVERQIDVIESGGEVVQETRLFDAERGTTRTMRSKEDEHDYRYFPEPDLPPVYVDAETVAAIRASLPELPAARRARYVAELGLSEYDAGVLTSALDVADFFEVTASACGDPKAAANWVANDLMAALGEADASGSAPRDLGTLRVRPEGLAELIGLVAKGTLNVAAARKCLRAMLETGKDAATLVSEMGLEQVSDTGEVERWVRDALAGQEKAVADIKAGNTKAIGAIIGPVMKASGGRANPGLVRETVLRLVAEEH